MKALAINGSPRTNCNTATLLNNALEGAASQGAETELVHLYTLNFKGCVSCFACKLTSGESYGRYALTDELTPVLTKAEEADAIILGSPIYFGTVTGEMRSFMERLLFPSWCMMRTIQRFLRRRSNGFNLHNECARRPDEANGL